MVILVLYIRSSRRSLSRFLKCMTVVRNTKIYEYACRMYLYIKHIVFQKNIGRFEITHMEEKTVFIFIENRICFKHHLDFLHWLGGQTIPNDYLDHISGNFIYYYHYRMIYEKCVHGVVANLHCSSVCLVCFSLGGVLRYFSFTTIRRHRAIHDLRWTEVFAGYIMFICKYYIPTRIVKRCTSILSQLEDRALYTHFVSFWMLWTVANRLK